MNRFKTVLIIVWVGIIGVGVGIPGVVAGDTAYSQKIVTFHEDVLWSEVENYASEWGGSGVSVVMELPIFNCLILKVPSGITDEELTNDVRVEKIENDQSFGMDNKVQGQFAGFIEAATEMPQDHYPWGILKLYGRNYDPLYLTDVYDPATNPDSLVSAFGGLDEHRIRIAVFDTGIYYFHENLQSIVKGGIDLVNKENLNYADILNSSDIPLDDNGHGTYIAGIISAALDPDGQWGRYSSVELYAVKILNEYAMGDISNIIMGLQWAIIHNIDIVNMSVGYRSDSPSIRRAVQIANALGLIMIASTGNHSNWDESVILAADGGAADGGAADGGAADGGAADGGAADGGAADGGAADGSSDSLPEFSVMYPARYAEVIAVGATTPFGELADYANSGVEMDILAPGSGIISADVTNGDLVNGYGFCNGTSQAAAHITAAAALMLSTDPPLGPEDMKIIMRDTANASNSEWAGEISLTGALEYIANGY